LTCYRLCGSQSLHFIEKTKNKKHTNDIVVPTVKKGVFVMSGKGIQLTTVDHNTDAHHKFEHIIAYTCEHITVLQRVFGIFFGIGDHVCYLNTKSEQDRVARKKAKTITTIPTAGVSDKQASPMLSPVPQPMPVLSPTMETKVVTAPVTHGIMINTLTQLPEEAKVNDNDVIARYVSRCLESIMLLYDWASHRLTLRVGYKTPMLYETDEHMFAFFKEIVDEFSPKEEKLNDM
jgi:hypothetical protein